MSTKILFADDQIPDDDIPDTDIANKVWAAHPKWDDGFQGVVNGFTAMRKVLNSLLDYGYNITVARRHKEAIHFIDTEKLDIIIVDLAWVADNQVPQYEQRNAGWRISEAIEEADRKAGRQPTPQIIYSSRFPEEKNIVSEVARRKKLPVHKFYDERDSIQLRAAIDFMESTFLADRRDQPAIVARRSGSLRPVTTNSVFLVHGHDHGARDTTARFLEKLGLKVTILQEEPSLGRTVIEKFEDHSDVGFAIVLLTPDDHGGTINARLNELKPRARQNVILELGFFVGALGRNRVCALSKAEVELPSDYRGVALIQMDDAGSWRQEVERELKAAGVLRSI